MNPRISALPGLTGLLRVCIEKKGILKKRNVVFPFIVFFFFFFFLTTQKTGEKISNLSHHPDLKHGLSVHKSNG